MTRTALLIEKLKNEITIGKWHIGQKIPTEHEISQIYRVGRNTVREAIKALSYSGLLEVRQGNGTFVTGNIDLSALAYKMTAGGLTEHFEMRCLMESEAAKLAAERRTETDIARIRQSLIRRKKFNSKDFIEEIIESDMGFHQAIAIASRNSSLLILYKFFSSSVRSYTLDALTVVRNFEPVSESHEQVFDAIIRQNPADAEKAVQAIINPLIIKLSSSGRPN